MLTATRNRVLRRLLSAVIALSSSLCPGKEKPAIPLDGVAAYVNEHIITAGEVQIALIPIARRLRRKHQGQELENRLQTAYVDSVALLVERRLILDAYEKQKGRIPEWAVDQRLESIIQNDFKGDRNKLLGVLRKESMTFDQWREEIRKYIIIASMRSTAVAQHVRIRPAAVRRYYRDNKSKYTRGGGVHLRMIVLNKGDSKESATRKKELAAMIRTKLVGGERFAKLAKDFSDGPKASSGGDWGWMAPSDLRRELAQAVQSLKPGAITEAVETRDEIYLVRVEERSDQAILPFEKVQSEIEDELRQDEAGRMYKSWIERLRDKAYVKIVDAKTH